VDGYTVVVLVVRATWSLCSRYDRMSGEDGTTVMLSFIFDISAPGMVTHSGVAACTYACMRNAEAAVQLAEKRTLFLR